MRNTYALLGLSMVPTVIGALVGIQLKFSFLAGSPLLSFLLFFGIAFGFMWGIEKTKNSGMGVVLLLTFTFFMGLMLSRLVGAVLGLKNGGGLVMMAFGGTAIIFAAMATLGTVVANGFIELDDGEYITLNGRSGAG